MLRFGSRIPAVEAYLEASGLPIVVPSARRLKKASGFQVCLASGDGEDVRAAVLDVAMRKLREIEVGLQEGEVQLSCTSAELDIGFMPRDDDEFGARGAWLAPEETGMIARNNIVLMITIYL